MILRALLFCIVCRMSWLVIARYGAQAGLAYSKTERMYCLYISVRVSLCCQKSVPVSVRSVLSRRAPFCFMPCIIIIIIIKKGRQYKAEREWCAPYQSDDPSQTIPTYRQKEEKGKKSRRLYIVGLEQLRTIKKHWPCSWNPPIPHHRIRC